MPNLGGYCPLPLRLGGGESTVRVIYESLNNGLGSAYDTTDASTVTAETSADARTIEALWSANARLTNQWDPRRMTDFIGRWEKIFALVPAVDDSDNTRRTRLAAKFQALGGPLYATTELICSTILGDAYIGVEYTSLADSHSNWPGGTPPQPDMWSSTVAHILVRVEQPANATVVEFLGLLNETMAFLGDFLPAWVTFDWGLYADNDTNGFYLDENNLDYQTFDA